MRPRHKAAENVRLALSMDPTAHASMRPRHKAAENMVKLSRVRPFEKVLQ